MWGLGYFARLPGSTLSAPLVFVLLVACLAAGGSCFAQLSPRGWRGAAGSGAVAGALNLLILGGLLSSAGSIWNALWWAPASVLLCAAISAGGALLARRDRARPERSWPAAFAFVAAGATALLLSVGGAVTGFEAGLAVPDWPASFGYNMFLFPLSRMTGGVYFEHAHRLIGSLVGLTTLTLAVYVPLVDRRLWVRALAGAALVMVILQGILGGLRVTQTSILLAIIHGVQAHIFFTLLVAIGVVCGAVWRNPPSLHAHPVTGVDKVLGVACVAMMLVQIILGALLRHIAWGLVVHICVAVVVLLLVFVFALRASSMDHHTTPVARLGTAVTVMIIAQFVLGFAALLATTLSPEMFAPYLQVIITTLHQTIGALLLAGVTALLLLEQRIRWLSGAPHGAPARTAGTAA
jgi:cytochrome c oxidase assembly protein subunit 15